MWFLVHFFPSNTYPRRHSKKWHEYLHQLFAEFYLVSGFQKKTRKFWQIFTSIVGWFLFRSKWNDFTFRWKLILPVVLTVHLQNSFGKPSESFRGFWPTYIAVKETLREESWKQNVWKTRDLSFSKQIGCNSPLFRETTVVQQWCSFFLLCRSNGWYQYIKRIGKVFHRDSLGWLDPFPVAVIVTFSGNPVDSYQINLQGALLGKGGATPMRSLAFQVVMACRDFQKADSLV